MKDLMDYLTLNEDGKTIERCDRSLSGDIVIPDGIEEIGDEAFCGTSITSIVIPDSVTYIGGASFELCSKLESVVFPKNERLIIGDCAFNECKSLKTVEIPNGARSIGECVFAHCTSLESVNIQPPLRQVGIYDMGGFLSEYESIFEGCTALSSITMPYLDEMIFYNLPSLKILKLLDGEEKYNKFYIVECDALEEIEIPSSLKELFMDNLFVLPNLKSINVSEDNQCYKSIDGVLFSKDGTELILYPGKREAAAYSIPEGVVTIQDHAFDLIKDHLESIKIPGSLKELSTDILFDMPNLKSIYVSEENQCYKSIDGLLYTKDGQELIAYPCGSEIKTLRIPEGVINFEASDLSNEHMSVKSIVIPNSFNEIDFDFLKFPNLLNIEVADNHPEFKVVDGFLCSQNGLVLEGYPFGRKDETLFVPEGIEFIRFGIYHELCSVCDVYLPNSLVQIGSYSVKESLNVSDIQSKAGMHLHCGDFYVGDQKVKLEEELPPFLGTDNNIQIPSSLRRKRRRKES